MGYFSDYINANFSFDQLTNERKKQLKIISEIRKRPILSFVTALTKTDAPLSISYDDKLPLMDQISEIEGDELDIILESPGGSADIVDDIVHEIRERFEKLAFIIPGYAKSAGTLMVMAGDEILMGPSSALGPIDAQIIQRGKVYSAQAFIDGFEKIKKEAQKTGRFNPALIPILQNINPGELESYQNALDFGKGLLIEWLPKYKFKFWDKHSSTGKLVTEDEKVERAKQVAEKLCDHSLWKTHGKPIKINDLRKLRLVIDDYSKKLQLKEAIERYYTLMQMYFERTPAYKLYETIESQIIKFTTPKIIPATQPTIPADLDHAIAEIRCGKCGENLQIQANFKRNIPFKPEVIPFPRDNILKCPSCNTDINIKQLREELETKTKRKIVE